MKILVTGGAGFIGSCLVRHAIQDLGHDVVNLDKMTYAATEDSLKAVASSDKYNFAKVDICDREAVRAVFEQHQPDAVLHLAAESHVDRSIDGPMDFMQTNVVGTFAMLEEARAYYDTLSGDKKDAFRFLHISTDEVFGDLEGTDDLFTEQTPYNPSSPYSASKAASDHFVRAWGRTYGLPVLITNCSNNYGPYQFPEKLIPVVISNALAGKDIPVYGDGMQIRDWLFVQDHVEALMTVVTTGKVGETYNVGGHNEIANIHVVKTICRILDERRPAETSYGDLITFVTDRPGHDMRYAIDAGKIGKDLGWTPRHTFETGIRETVDWYLDNEEWWQNIQATILKNKRLGLKGEK